MDQTTDKQKMRNIRQSAQQNFKRGTRRKPFAISSRLVLTKHKQICTIAIKRHYHQSMLLRVSFLDKKVLKKVISFSKLSNLLFILVLK